MSSSRFSLCFVLASSTAGLAFAQQSPPESLFIAAPKDALARVAPDPSFASDSLVGVRGELFAGATVDPLHPLRFALDLESGVQEIARLESRSELASGAIAFGGEVEGASQSQVIFVLRGEQVTGTVRDGSRLYKLNWAGAGWHRIARVDENRFPPCATNQAQSVGSSQPGQLPSGYLFNPNPTIDVMVVYTPLARQNAGGTVAIESLIDLAVLETNQAYVNSQAVQRLRLVKQQELTGYVEDGDFYVELDRLTLASDGFFDNIHTLRNQFGADEVAMIVDSTQFCGLGWLMTTLSPTFENHGFTVTSKQCATGYYSFAHELGHNMGSHHDHQNASGALYPYSYGYRTSSTGYRTIMAYAPGTRIQYFSNPNVSYQGSVLGIPEGQANAAENWKSLNNTASTVAQFRCAIPAPYGTGKLTSVGSTPSLSWTSTPSAGANNFHVLVSGGVPNKVGVLFYGAQSNAAPFFGGTLYVGSILARLPAQMNDSGGAADFAFPLGALFVGDVVFAQHWGRDPQHSDGTGVALSNGLRIDVCP